MRSLFLILLFASPAFAQNDLSVIWENNGAVKKISQEKNLEAYEDFVSLLGREPYDTTIQFNLGSSWDLLGETEKAEKIYLELIKITDNLLQKNPNEKQLKKISVVRLAALYNLGVQAQAKKQVDKALGYYQQALEINPDSTEIKHNIELLIQRGGGGGGGDSDQENQDQNQDGEGGEGQRNQEPKPKEQKPNEKEKKQPKEFDGKQMSKEDLKRILEELKEQEQGIRAKMQGKKGEKKDADGNDKEW
ncbi:MAG: tetratricopeptide repeat protein [Bdellovibrionales bacterium]|nr:tetratricopeptide repeat protein [Bdellovibrionales bacterium]